MLCRLLWASSLRFGATKSNRHIERLNECKRRVLVGKISGAVGTQAGLGEHAEQIQELVMKRLGLRAAEISTQIVQRDRYAELDLRLRDGCFFA